MQNVRELNDRLGGISRILEGEKGMPERLRAKIASYLEGRYYANAVEVLLNYEDAKRIFDEVLEGLRGP
ncbi:hypothetical protein [Acidilobus sp.]|uniref:hypothetical protein n=1 Tax=Acidilobus sp. TaxID=1872109 RepID=UPI003D0226DC